MKNIVKKTTLCLMTLMTIALVSNAQTLEIDKKSAEQIIYNTSIAAGHELAIRDTVKLSRKRNDSIMAIATTITALKNVYHNARRNINGFGRESAIYKQIKAKTLAILPKIGTAVAVTMNNPMSIGATYQNIMAIQRRVASLSKQYTQIVSNGHADNPLKKDDREGDGYNFLSSRDRYMLASSILSDLNSIDWQLTIIIYAGKQKASVMKILPYVDFKTYCSLWEKKNTAERIIDKINKLKNNVENL